jgi:two-component system response regulator ChvI
MSGEVWVVEDDRSLLQGIVTLLRSHGVEARGFSDPRSALDAALQSPPRVMITDFAMPALTGVELARELRTRLGASCPRLVLVTGSELRRVELTLFDQLVRKPFRFAALLPLIEGYLAPRPGARRASPETRLRRVGSLRRAGGEGE